MKLLLTVCLSGVGYRGWFPASDACISLWSWSTGSDWGRSRRNWAGGENTKSLGELRVSWAWLVFAGLDLPQFWTAGSWQGKKKFPSPEVQEEGTHQHVFAIKLRQFDSPTAHPPLPLCTSLKIRLFPPLFNCGAERETLRLWFIFALFLFFFEQPVNSSPSPRAFLWKHFAGCASVDNDQKMTPCSQGRRPRVKFFKPKFLAQHSLYKLIVPYLTACQVYQALRFLR